MDINQNGVNGPPVGEENVVALLERWTNLDRAVCFLEEKPIKAPGVCCWTANASVCLPQPSPVHHFPRCFVSWKKRIAMDTVSVLFSSFFKMTARINFAMPITAPCCKQVLLVYRVDPSGWKSCCFLCYRQREPLIPNRHAWTRR